MKLLEMVAGSTQEWHAAHVQMTAGELYQFGDELAATIRHPSTQSMLGWQAQAGARMAAILAEHDRRWRAVWRCTCNEGLSELLEKIYSVS